MLEYYEVYPKKTLVLNNDFCRLFLCDKHFDVSSTPKTTFLLLQRETTNQKRFHHCMSATNFSLLNISGAIGKRISRVLARAKSRESKKVDLSSYPVILTQHTP